MKAFCFLLHVLLLGFVCTEVSFTYEGFHQADMSLDGDAYVRSDGILVMTRDSPKLLGHAVYPSPLRFKDTKLNNKSSVVTFSTNFVFSIQPQYPQLGGHGLAFALLSTKEPKGCLPNQYLGLPNDTSNAKYSTRMLAVEFDTVQNLQFQDINDNHVGIDISSLISNISKPAAFYVDNTTTTNNSIILKSGDTFQVWIDYNSQEMLMNVTIAPLAILRPYQPLISFPIDLSSVLDDYMYVGFSASTGLLAAAHNVLGWSFRVGGKAKDLDISELPSLLKPVKVVHRKGFAVGITLASVILVFLFISAAVHVTHKIRGREEALEDWEVEYGARRFKYSDLAAATWGFGERNLIGSGGFGKVYKGIVPSTGLEVAIKRIAQDSRQGMREFVAEITSMGQLRHRKATTSTDVYSYGALMLEVASGRRPIEPRRSANEIVLVDWVRELQSLGEIVQAIDPTMDEYNPYEAELVLSLGLLCCHSHPDHRPAMRSIVQVLLGDSSLPWLPPDFHQEAAGKVTDYTDIYGADSDPSSGKASSSKSTSFSRFDKKVFGEQATRATF
ncbi:hypothetical protein RJ639_036033 [Escallonia herrerae]|uniref:non-specific serine/threonine protein kinase n=1 Tax=Escallonia herrerae TaxID=1293975 RepID=A0AA88WRU3_9ASTE|nr:hypothetical protein RJ639_036033 [Escallonia herrerae]